MIIIMYCDEFSCNGDISAWQQSSICLPISFVHTIFAAPFQMLTICLECSSQCATIIATPANQHYTQLGHFASGENFHRCCFWCDLHMDKRRKLRYNILYCWSDRYQTNQTTLKLLIEGQTHTHTQTHTRFPEIHPFLRASIHRYTV